MAFKASIKSCTITPPIGVFQGGYGFRKKHSIGIHDELQARCAAFSDGTTHAAIVVLDLVSVHKELVAKIKDLVCGAVPIPRENIIVAAMHTHSGPGSGRTLKGFARSYDLYLQILPYHVAGLIFWTFNELQEASVVACKGTSNIGHHRRTWDPSTNYVDRELVVARISGTRDGRATGLLFNIGCHAVKMNPDNIYLSTDYPSFTIKALESIFGPDVKPMFLQAPCGNINPWNQPYENPPSTFDDCRQVGEMLTGDVLTALGSAGSPVPGLPVMAGEAELAIPVEENLANSTNPDDFVRTRVQAILLGDYLSIIGVPGEMFSKFGRMIKDAVKTKFCIVQELVNNDIVSDDEMAYVPTREAFSARDPEHPNGGYEVAIGFPNPNAGYMIAEAAAKLANTLLAARGAKT
jgi:hypothetical protein